MSKQVPVILQYRSGPDLAMTLLGRPPEEPSSKSDWNNSYRAIVGKCNEVLSQQGSVPSGQEPLSLREAWLREVSLPVFDSFAAPRLVSVSGDADVQPFCDCLKHFANRVAGAALLLLPLTRQSSAPRPSSGPRYSREEAAQYDQQRDRIIAEKESLKGLQFRLNVRIGHWQSAALTKAQDCEVSRALALLSSDQGLTRHSGTPSFSAPLAVADAQVGPESAKTASVATVLNASPEIYELHQFGTDFQVWEYGDRVYSLTPTQAIVAKELSDFKRHSLSVLRGKVGDGWDSIDDVFTKRKDNPGRIEFWECFVQKFGDPPSMVQLSKIPLKPLS